MSAVSRMPLPQIRRALEVATERFANDLAAPSRTAPDWTPWQWHVAQAVASMHGVSPLLATALRWEGPPNWMRFLDEQRAHTLARHERFRELLGALDQMFRSAGIAALPLKGAGLFARAIYAPAERPMADIDLLIRPRDLEAARTGLESLGYRQSFAIWRHVVLKPLAAPPVAAFGEHRDNPIVIELHTHVAERLPLTDVAITESIWPDASQPGLGDYPSDAALMTHLLLHAAANMQIRALRLLHLEDIARLARRIDDAGWNTILGARPADTWWALPVLSLVARYRHECIPERVLAALRPHCSRWLRHRASQYLLSDVSLSDPRVRAFSGIEWAQSWPDMARYVARRIRPNHELLDERKQSTYTQPWAEDGNWARLPQGRRMLRWLVSRPRRTETMHALHLATQWSGDHR